VSYLVKISATGPSVLFDDLDQPIDDEPRVRAIAPDCDEHRIDTLFNAPGAFTWMLDDY
jgi:hypothetical protein